VITSMKPSKRADVSKTLSITCDICGMVVEPRWAVELSLDSPRNPISTRLIAHWDACSDCGKKIISAVVSMRNSVNG
jgi:hypothetical protein